MIGKMFAIDRVRMGTDGPGITTLVAMYQCPLNCEYCINNPIYKYREYSVKELYNKVKIDALYFEHTGGGICFGGHEPLLQQQFLIDFIKYVKEKGEQWKFGMETSLNAVINSKLFELLDYVIADIKTVDCAIYEKYTEKSNKLVLRNLEKLNKYKNLDIIIRLPMIPGYNDEKDIEKSKEYLRQIGYNEKQFDVFEYKSSIL